MVEPGNKSWTEYFRVITPFLLVILTWMGASLNGRLVEINDNIGRVDEKMFKHLTNEEIHIPRTTVVTKAEFDLMTKMRDKQLEDIKDTIKDGIGQLRIEIRNPNLYK